VKELAVSMNAGIRQTICNYMIAGNTLWEDRPCLHALGDNCYALLVAVRFTAISNLSF